MLQLTDENTTIEFHYSSTMKDPDALWHLEIFKSLIPSDWPAIITGWGNSHLGWNARKGSRNISTVYLYIYTTVCRIVK